MNRRQAILTALGASLSCGTASFAADRLPKEMRPKLLRDTRLLVEDDFEGPELDKKWSVPRGEYSGTAVIENGTCVIDSGNGRQGAVWHKFAAPVQNAAVQLLMKPRAVRWMGVRFLTGKEVSERNWKLTCGIFETGHVRLYIPDEGTQNKVIKAAATKLMQDDWWRFYFECKGDKVLVRVNGDEVMEMETEHAEGPKEAIMVNLYGGKGVIDEIRVMAAK